MAHGIFLLASFRPCVVFGPSKEKIKGERAALDARLQTWIATPDGRSGRTLMRIGQHFMILLLGRRSPGVSSCLRDEH